LGKRLIAKGRSNPAHRLNQECEVFHREEITMSTGHIIQTGIELAFALLLIYGFMNEEAIIKFEQNIKRIVVGHYRRWKRLRGKTNGKTNKKTHL
jgi:hypothetical protein